MSLVLVVIQTTWFMRSNLMVHYAHADMGLGTRLDLLKSETFFLFFVEIPSLREISIAIYKLVIS